MKVLASNQYWADLRVLANQATIETWLNYRWKPTVEEADAAPVLKVLEAYPLVRQLVAPEVLRMRGDRMLYALLRAIDPAERHLLLLTVKIELAEVYYEADTARPRGVRGLTKEKMRHASSLRSGGMSLKEIGKTMGVTEARVSQWMKAFKAECGEP
jgi:hypothetical protein